MSISNDPLNPRHLSSLVAIAEHGSFASAGHAIGRSHSAVSLHIKALEATLGTRLIDRTTRPVQLTPDGEVLAEHARRLERVLTDIRSVGQCGKLSVPFCQPQAVRRMVLMARRDGRKRHLLDALYAGLCSAAHETSVSRRVESLSGG